MPSITINVTAGEATRFQAAVGKALGLVDSQTPPQPRAATAEEARQFLIGKAKELVVNVEGKTAIDAIVVAAFTPT